MAVMNLKPFLNYDNMDITIDDSAFEIEFGADDDQGSYARLITGPNFGCIKFESKEEING